MKTYGEVDKMFYTLISTLNLGEWSSSSSRRFTPGIYGTGIWVDSKAGQSEVAKREIPTPGN
jgi:hypothetical protein